MATGVASWSTTAASNSTADSAVNWAEGMAPSAVNDSGRGMMASVAKWRDDLSGAITTAGTSTAFTATTNQSFASLSALDNRIITIVPHTTSGAAPTLAVDGLTAKAINISTGVAVPTGYLVSGTPYIVYYEAGVGEFIVLNAGANVAATTGTFSSTLSVTGASTLGTVSCGAITCSSTGSFAGILTQSVTSHGVLPSGTTAQRVGTTAGTYRYNTSRGAAEFCNGTLWPALGLGCTVQDLTSGTSATYTTPTGATWLRIRAVGGGGGGGGTGAGGTGGTTSFNSVTAVGGSGGGTTSTLVGGAGGTGGTGTATLRVAGSSGGRGSAYGSGISVNAPGACGGCSPFGGAGGSDVAGRTNSGSGGGGLSVNSSGNHGTGGGGGSGEYFELIIINPSATYTYSVGDAGAAGSGSGTAGGSGRIIVEEFYN